MDAGAIISVSAAVVMLTQFAKWGFVPDKRGPWAVLSLSLLGVVLWGWSKGDLNRANAFEYLAGFAAVALSAAGIYGFTRAAPEAASSFTQPPATGAGSSATTKE